MGPIEMTKLSSKGQLVLPQAIRRQLHLSVGEKFMVFCDGEDVILKKIGKPVLERFKNLVQEARSYARKTGITQSDVKAAVKRVRMR